MFFFSDFQLSTRWQPSGGSLLGNVPYAASSEQPDEVASRQRRAISAYHRLKRFNLHRVEKPLMRVCSKIDVMQFALQLDGHDQRAIRFAYAQHEGAVRLLRDLGLCVRPGLDTKDDVMVPQRLDICDRKG
jgi:hypothetical protein